MDNILRIASDAVSDRGLSEKRPQNEDSFLKMDQCGVYAVADGVGGAQAGEVASQMAMEILAEAFANRSDGDDPEIVMRTAIERANGAIHQMAHELPQLSSMATTIVALHLTGNIATIGHVGDSRLYRVDRNGILYPETADHSMVAEEVRAGRMTTEQAENHPSRNIISRALGAEATVDVELKTIMVEPGTAFLICSDGITRHVTDQEIKGVLTFGGDPAEICDYLKGLCFERGAEDNLTAVVVKLSAGDGVATDQGAVPIALEPEIPTIATARPSFENQFPSDDDDDDQLLELETREVPIPATTLDALEESDDEKTSPFLAEPAPSYHSPEPNAETPSPTSPLASNEETFSMFGEQGDESPGEEKSGSFGKVITALAMLIVGVGIGLGVYHFVLAPYRADSSIPQLSVMKSENIPLSAFEENRRNVDSDPAGYVAKFGSTPQDSEDYYLLGRAYLLSADYPKARLALTEAQNKLAEADPVNAKVLASDIAMALAVTNDTTIQSMLKKALEPAAPVNTNVNR